MYIDKDESLIQTQNEMYYTSMYSLLRGEQQCLKIVDLKQHKKSLGF